MSPQPVKKITIREPLILSDEESQNESDMEVIPPHQDLVSDLDLIPNTQMIEAAVEKEKINKKKRKAENQQQVDIVKKKKIDIEKEIRKAGILKDQATHVSILALILIIWTKELLLHIPSIIETLICLSLKEKQYEAKRFLHMLMDSLQAAQKHLVHQKKELEKCSLKTLVNFLLNSEWCTMYLEEEMTIETSTWITNKYAENFMGPSSSLCCLQQKSSTF